MLRNKVYFHLRRLILNEIMILDELFNSLDLSDDMVVS